MNAQEKFILHLQKVSAEVSHWPLWAQNIFGTVNIPENKESFDFDDSFSPNQFDPADESLEDICDNS
jgi:hypothetical protein